MSADHVGGCISRAKSGGAQSTCASPPPPKHAARMYGPKTSVTDCARCNRPTTSSRTAVPSHEPSPEARDEPSSSCIAGLYARKAQEAGAPWRRRHAPDAAANRQPADRAGAGAITRSYAVGRQGACSVDDEPTGVYVQAAVRGHGGLPPHPVPDRAREHPGGIW